MKPEPAPRTGGWLARGCLIGCRNPEAVEEVVERIIGRDALEAAAASLRLLHHLDVDHRRPVPVHQL